MRVLKIGAALAVLAAASGCERADDRAAAANMPKFSVGYCAGSLVSTAAIPVGGCVLSPNGLYALIMGPAGALKIVPILDGAPGPTSWTSGSRAPERDSAGAVLQGDGNFVIYDSGKPIWNSATNGAPGPYRLQLTDEGEALVQNSSGATLWSSKSGKTPPA